MKLIMTFENFVRFPTIFSCKAAIALAWVVCFLAPGISASELDASYPNGEVFVGEVKLVLGKAYVEGPGQARRRIHVGSQIKVNDKVMTEANGHVHIRFVDQALISIRPDSELEIVRYDFNEESPDESAIKVNLVEGVTRAISGKAAKSAPQRFRLNTPIAAIGVRGTDFVVSANQQTVRALVNEGIIVMAPFSAECTADTFGPCALDAVELTGESLQILEINSASPSLIPAAHERDPGTMRDEVQLAISGNTASTETDSEDKTDGSDVYLESVASIKVTASAAERARTEKDNKTPPPLPPVPVPTPEPEPVIPDFTPAVPVEEPVLATRQLLWGRWSWSDGQGELERITTTHALAAENREVTISSPDYVLFRFEEGGPKQFEKGLGNVGFALSSAQAFYHSQSGVVAMQVNNGSLNINFDNNAFSTSLDLNHALTGAINFSASGRLYSGGYFYDRSDIQNVVGAVSLDAKEAGYYFDKQLENGGIEGLTLWDSH